MKSREGGEKLSEPMLNLSIEFEFLVNVAKDKNHPA